jgi:hypothetical protein
MCRLQCNPDRYTGSEAGDRFSIRWNVGLKFTPRKIERDTQLSNQDTMGFIPLKVKAKFSKSTP